MGGLSKKVRDAKAKNEKEITYSIYEFPIAQQIWVFEVLLELK